MVHNGVIDEGWNGRSGLQAEKAGQVGFKAGESDPEVFIDEGISEGKAKRRRRSIRDSVYLSLSLCMCGERESGQAGKGWRTCHDKGQRRAGARVLG